MNEIFGARSKSLANCFFARRGELMSYERLAGCGIEIIQGIKDRSVHIKDDTRDAHTYFLKVYRSRAIMLIGTLIILLIVQCINWIETSGTLCRIIAKENTCNDGYGLCYENSFGANSRAYWHFEEN